MNLRLTGIAALLAAVNTGTALAHEPLFMMSHEAPGKGASDLHLAIHGERGEHEDETEFELEYTRGLTRNLALKISAPLVRQEERVADLIEGSTGVGDPTIRAKWRFWDRDVLAAKYAVAAMVQSTIPVGDGSGRLGSERPVILAGLSHGRESLEWYYFTDVRYLHALCPDLSWLTRWKKAPGACNGKLVPKGVKRTVLAPETGCWIGRLAARRSRRSCKERSLSWLGRGISARGRISRYAAGGLSSGRCTWPTRNYPSMCRGCATWPTIPRSRWMFTRHCRRLDRWTKVCC